MTTAILTTRTAPSRLASPLIALTGVAILLAIARGLYPGWASPLWLDETYTATIATQRDIAGLIDWCLHELSGPVYYSLTWGSARLFGASADALRLPSLICAIATPLLILWKGHGTLGVRLVWAVLLMLWLPGFTFASEARPYALLQLLTTAQVIVFHALIARGGLRVALAWSALTALIILTHYHALIVCAVQGVIYLVLRRHELARTWPAALVFVPVGAWMLVHVPFVLAFAAPGVASYDVLGLSDIARIPASLVGGNVIAALFLLAMIVTLALQPLRGASRREGALTRAELATFTASLLAAAVIIAIGFVKPSFFMRYLTPFMPGIFFGLAVWTVGRRFALLPAALVAATILGAGMEFADRVKNPAHDMRYQFNFEQSSRWLRDRNVKRFTFYWDSTITTISTRERLGEVGSFFLRRDGWTGPVSVPVLAGTALDPNIVLAAAAPARGDGFVWIYDHLQAGTRARLHPPRIGRAFECRNFGATRFTVLACIRL